ncbi:MAG: penicillin-binding protein 1A [Pseudomonadota bacterium]
MTSTLKRPLYLLAIGAVISLSAAWLVIRFVIEPGLPPVASIREIKLPVPLRVFSADGKLMAEFGAERREPLTYAQIPPQLVQAFLAAEDDRFFEHPGVDWQGLARAGVALLTTGEKRQGGSTITMQLARNVFLSSERSFVRKGREILLALKIEKELNKQEILEIYLNKIFLGNRAYGVGAAAQVYFGRDARALSLSQMAVLAALPKAPSRDNPLSNPTRAVERRNYVLRRMQQLGMITAEQQQQASAEPLSAREARPGSEVEADFVAEMVRAELIARYGEQAYETGYTVITTIDSKRQTAAVTALRAGLSAYDERRGWRGAEARLPAEAMAELKLKTDEPHPLVSAALESKPAVAELIPAMVLEFAPERLRLWSAQGVVELKQEGFSWANFSKDNRPAPGDLVRVRRTGKTWRLAQIPEAQGALVALDPHDGAIQSLSGGFDFFHNKYNHVTQARRQPGSGFKPFFYAAALAGEFTPASVILDAPIVFDDPALESSWRPENYGGDFKGPMRLREALIESRNLVSIRILQAIGIDNARDYAARFGFDPGRMPRDLTLALGTPSYTPLDVARGYAVFANGGFLVTPYFIKEIRDAQNTVLFQAQPLQACPQCPVVLEVPKPAVAAEGSIAGEPTPASARAPRVIDPANVYLMRDLLRDVATRGTAARVRELGRNDLAGKTGTTNEETDAWFNGFQSSLVAVAWVGYDQPTPLGKGEVGGRAALPIWMDFMRSGLKGVPEDWPPLPAGLVTVRINPLNGKLAQPGDTHAIPEIVPVERLPTPDDGSTPADPQQPVDDLY